MRQRFDKPFALQAHLPEGYPEATEILKVIATPRIASFRSLELPPLDQPPPPPPAYRTGDPLERLLLALAVDAPATDTLRSGEVAGPEWATAQVQIRLVPKGTLRRR